MPELDEAVEIRIFGIVQGVGFRFWTKMTADKLGLKGMVRNVEDGSVFARFCGQKDKLEEMAVLCHKGPFSARVESVEITAVPLSSVAEKDGFHLVF